MRTNFLLKCRGLQGTIIYLFLIRVFLFFPPSKLNMLLLSSKKRWFGFTEFTHSDLLQLFQEATHTHTMVRNPKSINTPIPLIHSLSYSPCCSQLLNHLVWCHMWSINLPGDCQKDRWEDGATEEHEPKERENRRERVEKARNKWIYTPQPRQEN